MVKERTKQKSDMAGKEETFKEMQATILRNEGVIQMLKAQLQQQQMRQREDEDERFMDRRLIMDESSVSRFFFQLYETINLHAVSLFEIYICC